MKKQSVGWSVAKFFILLIVGWLLFVMIFTAAGFVEDVENTSSITFTNNGEVDENIVSTVEQQTTGEGMLLALACGFGFTIVVIWITDYNKCRQYQADIPKFKGNIQAALEKSDRLTGQATKVVEKYAAHEADVQKNVAQARGAANSQPIQSVSNAHEFRLAVERYPNLRANENALKLLSQIEDCEGFIANQKMLYNQEIANYNFVIRAFPFVMLRRCLKLNSMDNTLEIEQSEITDEMLGI